MNEQFPLEQVITHNGTPRHDAFAPRAIEVVPVSEDYVLEPVSEGVRVRAANEPALELPAAILRETFGDELSFQPIGVKMQRHGALTYEPWMFARTEVRISAQLAVRDALRARAATILEEEVRRQNVVTRALGAQRSLLGFPAQVRETAGESARLWIWLSHYAPLDSPEGGMAA